MVDHEGPFKSTKCSEFKLAKCNERDRDWSALPLDVLRDIYSRLMFLDSYSFAHVCTSWRSAEAQLSPQKPLLFLHKNYFNPKPFCKLLDPTNNLSDNFHMPVLGGKVCIGSQYGWLILVDNTVDVISLYNPLSQKEIKLPSHAHFATWFVTIRDVPLYDSHIISRWFSFQKVVLAPAPISSTKRFLAVAALFDSGNFMYKRDGPYGWKLFGPQHSFQDITSWRGMFVGVTWEKIVYKFDLDKPEPAFEYMGVGSYDTKFNAYNKHLVNLADNLLQVWWYIDSHGNVTVKVIQLDLQLLTWNPVDDLCGHSLFLSVPHSFSLPSQHVPGLKDNLIYFIEDRWGIEEWEVSKRVGVFNMRNGTYEISTPSNFPLTRTTSTFWYAPPPSV